MPFYRVPPGFSGGCSVHHHGPPYTFHHHHHHGHRRCGPPFLPHRRPIMSGRRDGPRFIMMNDANKKDQQEQMHNIEATNKNINGDGPPFPPHPIMMAGRQGPHRPISMLLGRRGPQFMMMNNNTKNKTLREQKPTDAEETNGGSSAHPDPVAVDGPPFPPPQGPLPHPMMAGRGPPMSLTRQRPTGVIMVNINKDLPEQRPNDTEEVNGGDGGPSSPDVQFSKPLLRRRPHHCCGPITGDRYSGLPWESQRPLGISLRNGEKNKRQPETSTRGPPPAGVQVPVRHHHPPRPPPHHIHQGCPRRHFENRMLLSLLEEQKRTMEEEHGGQSLENPTIATTVSRVVLHQVPHQWHIDDIDQSSMILSIDVTGFKLEDLELKVEHGLLSLQGQRTNSLGQVFELFRTKMIDPTLYNEAGIEARCDNHVESSSSSGSSSYIVRITIPKKAHTFANNNDDDDGAIPIQIAHHREVSEEQSPTTTTAATVIEENEKEQTETEESGGLECNIFIPEAEIVFERDEEDSALVGQVETVQDSSVATFQDSYSVATSIRGCLE